jgi:hypothetical protein
VIASTIERRLLVNYRLDPEAATRLLPRGMRPDLANGYAVGGICLIRLGGVRPQGIPARCGLRTENAAHRIAVVWDTPAGPLRGVYIPRRDTSSALTAFLGGRVFPGEQHHARFEVREHPQRMRVGFRSADGHASARVEVRPADGWNASVLFEDVESASRFFRDAPIGFVARESGPELDGVRLGTGDDWRLLPMELISVESGYFGDTARFPSGTAHPDSALLMCDVSARWSPHPAPACC